MNAEKNSFFWKKINIQIFKVIVWICFGLIYTSFSITVPTGSNDLLREIIVFLFIALVLNINTSYLFPIIYKKNKIVFIATFAFSALLCISLELLLFIKNFSAVGHHYINLNKYYFSIICYICIRDVALFVFFIWIEYFNRIILLHYKQEQIYKKEIALLLEKQDFEKKFSRKKILPHYLFNIMEHICVKSINNKEEFEILDKFKFVLYYFLVDSEKEKVELEKELVFYKHYIDLENFRNKNKVDVRILMLGNTENFMIIPLLFEPLIGNAMKHTKHDGTGLVNITIDTTKYPKLHFYCSNNFPKNPQNITSSENGLKIMEQRLSLCYKNKYSMKTIQEDDLYKVYLSINVE